LKFRNITAKQKVAIIAIVAMLFAVIGVTNTYADSNPVVSSPALTVTVASSPTIQPTPVPTPDPTPTPSIIKKAVVKASPELTVKKVKTPSPEKTTETKASTKNKTSSYRGIHEGDVIRGKLYHYTVSAEECGKTNGITASGKRIYNGMPDPHIVACNWLPLGTVVEFNGVRYTVLDRGGVGLSKVGNLDVFCPGGKAQALRLGVSSANIKIIDLP
jgi:hypothetical protein